MTNKTILTWTVFLCAFPKLFAETSAEFWVPVRSFQNYEMYVMDVTRDRVIKCTKLQHVTSIAPGGSQTIVIPAGSLFYVAFHLWNSCDASTRRYWYFIKGTFKKSSYRYQIGSESWVHSGDEQSFTVPEQFTDSSLVVVQGQPFQFPDTLRETNSIDGENFGAPSQAISGDDAEHGIPEVPGTKEEQGLRGFSAYAPPFVWGPWVDVGSHLGKVTYTLRAWPVGRGTAIKGRVAYWAQDGLVIKEWVNTITITTSNSAATIRVSFTSLGVTGTAVQGDVRP